jgi:RHS repeat-associated protein
LSATYNYQPFNKLTNTATTSYVYNANGNMVSKTTTAGTTQFYWDYENRLKQVILPNSQSVVYKYDALGRRSERNVNNSTSWTKFTYDGQDVILDQNSDGTSVTYLNGLGIDNKIRQTVGGQAQYFLSDHLGSTNALTDATGNVIASTNYDSFGNATNASFPTRYQFTGREFDSLTGLQFSRARWYDGNLGRFISEDPIGLVGGINQFAYANNNASNLADPSGLDGCQRLPNGRCEPVPEIPMGGGEPPRRPPRFNPPRSSPTPSVTPNGTPPSSPTPTPSGSSNNGSVLPQGIVALTGSASGFFGIFNGAGATVGGAVGFANDGKNLKFGSAGSLGGWADTPSCDRWAYGAAAGAGGGIFVSNATSFEDLNGYFDSYQAALGPIGGVEIAYSGDIWTFSYTYGRGAGVGITHYQTYTPDWTTREVVIY